MQEDHTAELMDRMQRIEDILRNLVDQGHPRGAPLVFDVLPSALMDISDELCPAS